MPVSIFDPFFIANNAIFAALKANRSADDLEYLRAFYRDSGVHLNDCEIASATYLSWHESLRKSGVRFEEHLAKLGAPICKLDAALADQFTSQKEEAVRSRVAYAIEEERRSRNLLFAGGGGVAILAGAAAWLYFRRRSKMRATTPAGHDV